jgi:hypothetical protein
MSATPIVPVKVSRAANGVNETDTLAAVDAGNGNSFVNTGRELLIIDNGDASSKTATIVSTATVDGLAVADLPVVVAAGKRAVVGPFPPSVYGSPVTVTWSAGTSVKAMVLQVVPELN